MVDNRVVIRFLLVVVATLSIGCGNGVIAQNQTNSLTLPEIPSTITDLSARREYLSEHYWDGFDFSDIELIKNDSLMGYAVAGYIQVLMMNSPDAVEKSVDISLSRALKHGYEPFERLSSKLEDYLYHPNSPMRNEELYIYVLRYTVEKSELEPIYKLRSRAQLEMALKNRVGEVATDFEYENRAGKLSTLQAIESPYTILFFNTPDCEDCTRVKNYIGGSSLLTQMVDVGVLTILGIYTEGNIEMWREALYPSNILNTADTKGKIDREQLYDLKALPCLYLLGSDKRVLLKDLSIEQIERALMRSQSR